MTLGDRLRLARSKRGLTQRELGKRCAKELSDGYISMLEKDPSDPLHIKNPGFNALRDIARVLDVPLEWLAEGKGDEPAWPVEKSKAAAGGGAQ